MSGLCFLKTEKAHHRLLYGGAIKLYWLNSELTKEVVNKQYMSRNEFKEFYKNIFGKENQHLSILNEAEEIRDKIIHGKKATTEEIATAIENVIEYAKRINTAHSDKKLGGFTPFGSMKGFKGRAESHDKRTTRLILKGLGFSIK